MISAEPVDKIDPKKITKITISCGGGLFYTRSNSKYVTISNNKIYIENLSLEFKNGKVQTFSKSSTTDIKENVFYIIRDGILDFSNSYLQYKKVPFPFCPRVYDSPKWSIVFYSEEEKIIELRDNVFTILQEKMEALAADTFKLDMTLFQELRINCIKKGMLVMNTLKRLSGDNDLELIIHICRE